MWYAQYWLDTGQLQCEGEYDPNAVVMVPDPADPKDRTKDIATTPHVDARLGVKSYLTPPDLTAVVWSDSAVDYVPLAAVPVAAAPLGAGTASKVGTIALPLDSADNTITCDTAIINGVQYLLLPAADVTRILAQQVIDNG